MFMRQTYVSQRYLPLSTRSFLWFALWPHFACIFFPYGYALVSEAETLICARKNSSAKSVYYMNLCSNVVGLASEGYLLFIWNVAFVLPRQGKYSPTPLLTYLLTPWSRVLLEKLTSKLCS